MTHGSSNGGAGLVLVGALSEHFTRFRWQPARCYPRARACTPPRHEGGMPINSCCVGGACAPVCHHAEPCIAVAGDAVVHRHQRHPIPRHRLPLQLLDGRRRGQLEPHLRKDHNAAFRSTANENGVIVMDDKERCPICGSGLQALTRTSRANVVSCPVCRDFVLPCEAEDLLRRPPDGTPLAGSSESRGAQDVQARRRPSRPDPWAPRSTTSFTDVSGLRGTDAESSDVHRG